jgi:hypothetical protein
LYYFSLLFLPSTYERKSSAEIVLHSQKILWHKNILITLVMPGCFTL